MGNTRSVISFISAKGGSGKTVTASSIGRFLAQLGFRTLLVDTDASTNGLTLLFLSNVTKSKGSTPETSGGVFDGNEFAPPKITSIEDGLDLVPATYTMSQTEDTPLEKFERSLRNIVAFAASYDFVLLDAQAGSDSYAKISASVADQVVIVTEFDPISFQGVDRLKILFSSVMEPRQTWVLFNKILPEFATAIGEGLIVAQVLPPIPWDIDVIRSFAQRELAINTTQPNAYTIGMSQVIARLCGDEVKDAVRKWTAITEGYKIRPILDRVSELENEITYLEKDKIATELRIRRMKTFPLVLTGLGAGAALGAYQTFRGYLRTLELRGELGGELSGIELLRGFLLNGLGVGWSVFFMIIFASILYSGVRSRRSEQKLLEQQQFISRRLEDINEERKRLKITADAFTVIERKREPATLR